MSQSATPGGADPAAMMRYDANKRSAGIGYVLWFFFGWFGAHRFYFQRTGSAVAQLVLTIISFFLLFLWGIGLFGFLVVGIWVLVDAFLIPGLARDYNNALIQNIQRV